jgi:hypothetical protein
MHSVCILDAAGIALRYALGPCAASEPTSNRRVRAEMTANDDCGFLKAASKGTFFEHASGLCFSADGGQTCERLGFPGGFAC